MNKKKNVYTSLPAKNAKSIPLFRTFADFSNDTWKQKT